MWDAWQITVNVLAIFGAAFLVALAWTLFCWLTGGTEMSGTIQRLDQLLELTNHNHQLLHAILQIQGVEKHEIDQLLAVQNGSADWQALLENHSHTSEAALSELLRRLGAFEERIMATIAEYAVKQKEYNAEIKSDLSDIKTQISDMNALILKLQTTPGPISTEDQATLDELQAAGKELTDQADATAGKTPPVVPAG